MVVCFDGEEDRRLVTDPEINKRGKFSSTAGIAKQTRKQQVIACHWCPKKGPYFVVVVVFGAGASFDLPRFPCFFIGYTMQQTLEKGRVRSEVKENKGSIGLPFFLFLSKMRP